MEDNSACLSWSRDDFSNIENPFEGDLWDRTKLANQLENYIKRLKVGATLALDGEWGAGKSWFVQHFIKQLSNKGHKVIYLDAFIHDYIEDPFLILATEISNITEEEQSSVKATLKTTAVNAYHALLPNLPMLLFHLTLALSGAGMFAKGLSDVIKDVQENSGDFGEKCAELMGEQIKAHLEEKVDNYENEKQSLTYFKKELEKVTSELKHPLVFVIDELDRCKPEFSIRLIERIKHFFDIPNIVFILVMHKSQLTESIDSYYGFKTKNIYLEKFIDFTIQLNTEHHFESINYREIVESYFNELGIGTHSYEPGIMSFLKEATWLAKYLKALPRQIKKVLNKFSLLKEWGQPLNNDGRNIILIFLFLDEVDFTLTKNGDVFDFIVNKFKSGSALKEQLFTNISIHLEIPFYGISENSFFKLVANEAGYEFANFLRQYFLIKFESGKMTWEKMLKSSDYRPPNNQQVGSFEEAWFDYIHQGI